MLCPHCSVASHVDTRRRARYIGVDGDLHLAVSDHVCPECARLFFLLHDVKLGAGNAIVLIRSTEVMWPKKTNARLAPPDVDETAAADFNEAAAVLSISPKASAALGRRCLQYVLRSKGEFTQKDLAVQIDAAIASPGLSQPLKNAIDAIRNVGAFATHPMKHTNSGEIVAVETGEAEWVLDTLESLFDHYYVQPAALARKRVELNKKLKDHGKPEMK